ncbi:G-type lectin S-receptor-like serine/threonine-protein kinase B120 [Lolium rigidum]|uniref:G-type lectin S-receptor-like serine/threonine-protein kinase B120 n=1 Tax=Lolium rigidum TaxID=89674 RepID=UPI001F5CC931|nr:G-type lectin S-receptor-like serine/threonine-protein kinase B120 [Lolium rigidum]
MASRSRTESDPAASSSAAAIGARFSRWPPPAVTLSSLPVARHNSSEEPHTTSVGSGRMKKMALQGKSCIPIFILLSFGSLCRSDDQLTNAKPLSSADTLVSKAGDFALGFFSPSDSNASLYLGIWYNNIPGRTVVWTANREDPIPTSSSPMLAITNSSGLVLSDSRGRATWSTKNNITATGVAAVLLDTGNFVLQYLNGTIIWQSFDHPTDTLLPSMRFLLSYGAHYAERLVAWKGPDDPSSGDFSCSGDPASPDIQFVTWNKTRPYYRMTVSDGVSVNGGMYVNNGTRTTVNIGDLFYFMFTISNSSDFMRIKLDYTGKLQYLRWNTQSSSWTLIAEIPTAPCDLYSSCGPSSYCDFTRTVPTCQCLDGFEPDGNNVSRGCRRIAAIKCGTPSHFVALPRMKIPDNFLHIRNRSFDQCEAECSRNCSCTAYAYAHLNSPGAMADPSRCLVWSGELVDTGKYQEAGENVYLRLSDSPGMHHTFPVLCDVSDAVAVRRNRKSVKIVLPTVVCSLMVTCVVFVMICKYKASKHQKTEIKKRPMLGYLRSFSETGVESAEFPFVSFEDIVAATDNFADSKQIGRGGFGKVYKGMLEGVKEVAIKRLSKDSGQGVEEFKNEIVLIAKLQHKNLVRLIGCCIHRDERLLIYEYLPNKSLDAFLFDATRHHVLNWPARFKIIQGVARGLLYLHQDSRLTIIHRDLKASNVLLDSEMTPKISDFGMARIFGGNQQQENTTHVVGTYGYMSPEYAMRGDFSVKSDTYSFGILLLEIAWRLWKDGKAAELMQSSVSESCPLHEAVRCIHVGLLCVQDDPDDRPLMSSVIFMLGNEIVLLPAPKRPAYFALRHSETQEGSSNVLSITTLDGR